MGLGKKRPRQSLRIAFCHPDLGLGGAERLIVDAAQELADRGHEVEIFTAFHDPHRCFEETVNGSFKVTVRGGWFPRSIFGRAMALCAYIRCFLLALSLVVRSYMRREPTPDIVIVDQVSAIVSLLQWLLRRPVLFYCHFPDYLLASPKSRIHRLYRCPLDWLEETTTGSANEVVVNSKFTQGVFAQSFPRLAKRGLVPEVLYPAVIIPSEEQLSIAAASWRDELPPQLVDFLDCHGPLLVSINRFERKKNIGVAVRAFALVLKKEREIQPIPGLVLAGGYDPRLAENVEHLAELRGLAEDLGVAEHVAFLPSFTDQQRGALLACATVILYTPTNEHFGIVPLEAGAAKRAVIACSSGGPLESIVAGQTGELCPPQPQAWAEAICGLLDEEKAMGERARERVISQFSRKVFGDRLEDMLMRLVSTNNAASKRKKA